MANKKNQLPDFDDLNDRLIAEPSPSPSLVIKTNLDKKDVASGNPYAKGKESPEFEKFFKDDDHWTLH